MEVGKKYSRKCWLPSTHYLLKHSSMCTNSIVSTQSTAVGLYAAATSHECQLFLYLLIDEGFLIEPISRLDAWKYLFHAWPTGPKRAVLLATLLVWKPIYKVYKNGFDSPQFLVFLCIQFYELKKYLSLITWQIDDESHLLLNGIKIVIYYTDFSNSDNLVDTIY